MVYHRHSYGAFDSNCPPTVATLSDAGLDTDVYMFPCAGQDPVDQVAQLVDDLQVSVCTAASSTVYFISSSSEQWCQLQCGVVGY